jgi:hypothetical protein
MRWRLLRRPTRERDPKGRPLEGGPSPSGRAGCVGWRPVPISLRRADAGQAWSTESAAGYRETIHPAIRATTSRSIPL